jgi:hypothetical protein
VRNGVTGSEPVAELLAQPRAPLLRHRRIAAAQVDDVVRCLDEGQLAFESWHRDRREVTVRRPGHEDAVGLVGGVDLVVERAVEVDEVLVDHRPEHLEVEPGVGPHERIERPGDPAQAALGSPRPLAPLHRLADAR